MVNIIYKFWHPILDTHCRTRLAQRNSLQCYKNYHIYLLSNNLNLWGIFPNYLVCYFCFVKTFFNFFILCLFNLINSFFGFFDVTLISSIALSICLGFFELYRVNA